MEDPFASAPEPTPAPQPVQEEPKGDPWAETQKAVGAVNVDVKPHSLPVSEIVTTFKGSGEAPWVVIHASSVQESNALLDQQFADYLTKVKRVASFFAPEGFAAPQGGNPQQRPLQNGQPAGSVEAPSWAPPKPYDDAVYKTGVSKKNGKVWHAWMPPTKEDSRQAKFFDPR